MELPESVFNGGALIAICVATLSGIGTITLMAAKWVLQRFEQHDKRIDRLEDNFISRSEFQGTIEKVYTHMEVAFKRLDERLDQIYQMMVRNSS